ncbi:DUF3226 domain-containing protein [Helicobacter japonicus]|uniref:DUF4435 domain-containing protein n=1 Tax=Helicobacter japonicus TaxID=425400 RepID=A0A4U8TRJ6_9HELI|nr:DUF3226 domain-containing protein [Helicobacter japonicus]TLE03330.1 hypothetical protein LS65_000735 [Helicobacter japonicus]
MTLFVVEGKSDKVFLEQYIYCKNSTFEYEIIENGNNNLQDSTLTQIKKALDKNNRVCIIFDADLDCNQTRQSIENKIRNYKDMVEIFLFPDNKNKGNLETLLSDIAKYKEIIECFEKYVKCLESHSKHFADNIYKKSKMYAYREASGLEKNMKSNKNALNKDIFSQYFDFDSPYLQPLHSFIFNL